MTRSIRARVESISRRLDLKARPAPYWEILEPGIACGYYRPRHGVGSWWGRVRVGGKYIVESLAIADDFTDADGERVLSWPQAQACTRAWAARQAQGGPTTVADAVEAYLLDLRARKGARAAHGARLSLEHHLLPKLGDIRLADLTVAIFRGWVNGLVVESDDPERVRRSRNTANRILAVARATLNFAYVTELVSDNSAWRKVKRFPGVGGSRKIILTDAEVQRLIDHCGPGLRELVALGAWTGARWGELTSALVRDFDAGAGTLAVDGKTGHREIHLPPAAVQLLRRLASGRRGDDYLLTPANGQRWTVNLHHRGVERAVKAAGLDPTTVFYSLRHSFISRGLKQGVPVKALADHCGTSMVMIERVYGKFIVEDRKRYAATAAPPIVVKDTGAKVVPLALRPGKQ